MIYLQQQKKIALIQRAYSSLSGYKTYHSTCVWLFGDFWALTKPKPAVQVIWAIFWARADESVLLR